MDNNEYLSKIVYEQLGQGHPVAIATIISLQGSSPRHNGTKMVITVDGKSHGTIGGSLLEAESFKEAKIILEKGHSKLIQVDLNGRGVYSERMICGGNVKVLLDYISTTKENLDFYRLWQEVILKGRNCYLLTCFYNQEDFVNVLGRSLLYPEGKLFGNIPLSPAHTELIRTELHNITNTTIMNVGDIQVLIDPIMKLKTLFCFGAGHVAVPTVKIAAMVGFRVIVIDDRLEFANIERFPEAYKIQVIDFEKAFEGLEIDADSFIVIITRGHQFDRVVLEQALQTEAGYIGMISSRRKRESIYKALMETGIPQEDLKKVHSPIGIEIGGETPEEIAVSIVAELINERCKQQKTE